MLLEGYEGIKKQIDKIPAVARGRLAEAADRVARLYDLKGDSGAATKWREEAAWARKALPAPGSPPKP